MTDTKTARVFLGLNAAFSLLIGVALLIAPGIAAELLFGVPAGWQPVVLRVLGAGLILFGLGLVVLVRDRFLTRGQVHVISAMDAGWVLASAVLLMLGGDVFSSPGRAAIVAVAGVVAAFAIGQVVGARKIVPRPGPGQAAVRIADGTILATVSRPVNAPADVVWRVMTDHPGYADVADNISKVEVVKGDGIGMQRRCYGPKGENWLETCDLYEEGQAFGFRIHTDAEDYPYPISDLRGKWSVERHGSGSVFTIAIEAVPKGNIVVRTLFKAAARRQFRAVLEDLAVAWADRMEREARA